MWRLFLLQNLLKKRQLACIISLLVWQHDDDKNLDSPYFADNLNTPDNVCKNTHTKLFKLQFSGASGNNQRVLPVAGEAKLIIMWKYRAVRRAPSKQRDNIFSGQTSNFSRLIQKWHCIRLSHINFIQEKTSLVWTLSSFERGIFYALFQQCNTVVSVIYTVTSSLFVAALFSLSCLSTSATWSLSSLRKRITIR